MSAPRLPSLASSPVPLLAICGFLFASKFMIIKAALDVGAQPFQLAFVANLGAGLCLLAVAVHTGKAIPLKRSHIALYVVLGLLGFALPTLLAYAVVQRVGPAYTSTVYSLSPLATMAFAAGFGIERMTLARLSGVLLGFSGMLMLVGQQIASIDVGQPLWVVLGLLLPASAAAGNIIRTRFWPKNASPLAFSCATLLTASAIIAGLAIMFEPPWTWQVDTQQIALWLAVLTAASALSYALNYRLQYLAGPVVFSQIGYWGAAFGILLGALLFGDVLGSLSIAGIGAILGGGLLARRAA